MRENKFMEKSNLLLKRLLENNIDFVLIGGYAAVVHGVSQVTHDLDICSVITPESLIHLRAALADLAPKHRMNPNFQPSLNEYPPEGQILDNYYLRTNAGVLDILKEVAPAGSFEEIKKRAIEVQVFGYKCKVISIDDLIAIKSVMKRPKDQATLAELLVVKERLKK